MCGRAPEAAKEQTCKNKNAYQPLTWTVPTVGTIVLLLVIQMF